MRQRIRPVGFILLLSALAAVSCGIPSGAVPPLTLAPTGGAAATAPLPTPVPEPETLIVCTAEEPASLFLYSARGASTEAVFAALYDGPVDAASFSLQPVLLSKLPSQADGDIVLEPVAVRTGEVFFDPLTLAPRNLTYNDSYLPSGCTSRDCLRVFQGGEVTMDRMRVEFKLQPARFWSDGQPLTAGDSVFAYEVDSRPETPSSKFLVDRTAAYEALDDLTLRWTGIPGYLDGGAPGNVWTPLPRHLLDGVPAAELPTTDLAARTPLGWGAYAIEKWTPGRELVLERNAYFVSAEGAAPAFDRLVYRFLQPGLRQGMQQLLTGECDVLDESLALSTGSGEDYNESLLAMLDLQEQGLLQVVSTPGVLVEQLTFNVRAGQRDNPLAQPGVRMAVAMCLDRGALAQATWRGLAGVATTYLPPAHPLADPDGATPVTDREAARQLLQQAGWVTDSESPSAPRIAAGAAGALAGAPLEFTLSVASGGLDELAASEIQRQLSECGIRVVLDTVPVESLGAPFPEGPVFGAGFESVLWAWPTWSLPPCELFLTSEIPSQASPNGVNASGFSSAAYDRACSTLLFSGGWGTAASQAAADTQALLAEGLPALPLFARPRLLLAAPEVCGLTPDPAIPSLLWAIEKVTREEGCSGG